MYTDPLKRKMLNAHCSWCTVCRDANFVLRLGLSKLLPQVFYRPSFLQVQDASLGYKEIVRRAHLTTQRLLVLGAALLALMLAAFVRMSRLAVV